MVDSSTQKEQYLGLKVMRLLKPSLYSSLPYYQGNENNSNIFDKLLLEQAYHVKENKDINLDTAFNLSDFLILPQSFGNIFIGEIFSSYICIHNHTTVTVSQLSVKVELQTKSQKLPLQLISKHGDYVAEFQYDQTYDAIIHHAVKELGLHVVNYTTENDEKMNFKKFFKFIVSKPFEIQPKFPNFENPNVVLFEAQVQNLTNNILYMEKVVLEPNEGLKVEDLNVYDEKNPSVDVESKSIFGPLNYMKPTEIKQYLFRITSLDSKKPLVKPLTIGKLDIVWRNPFSDIGRLQTNPLTQVLDTVPIKKDIEVNVVQEPDLCYALESTKLDLEVKNLTERNLDLEMIMENEEKHGFLWNCVLNKKLGKFEPNESKIITTYIVPFKTGLLEITGLTINDTFLKRAYEFTSITKIFSIARHDETEDSET